ncbi:MAG: pilus assembly protein TadG-related protein [Roseiarcus sp.]
MQKTSRIRQLENRVPVSRLLRDSSAATTVLFAILAPVLIGAMGLAAEASYWRIHQNAMQHASDSAAMAAATNGSTNYAAEAKAVAAKYGFVDGVGNVTVTVTVTPTGCTSSCHYSVTISDGVPAMLSAVVGYHGNTKINGQSVTSIAATATSTATSGSSFCVLALATSGAEGIRANGSPKSNLSCNVMSDTDATCDGGDLNAPYGAAHGTNDNCGVTTKSNVPVISDPYSARAANIPADTCTSFPQEPAKKNNPALPAANQWSGVSSMSGVQVVCGDQQLVGNTTINNTVLVIENGQLDTNGYTLTGLNLAVVFTGINSASYQHIPTGGGTLQIAAPTSGNWSGVAIYQDPSLTTNVNISAAGNSPAWDLSGLVYLPHSTVTLSGAVNKSSQGQDCFVMVIDNITVNGTALIFANDTQCAAAGLNPPTASPSVSLVN